jgi:ADP-heptose:LPS heptosyltransferase
MNCRVGLKSPRGLAGQSPVPVLTLQRSNVSVNASQGKILVIRGGAIGDFILTLPAIAALRKNFPDAYLEVLGYPHIAQLAFAGGLVDRVESLAARALAGFFARNGELAEELVDYFSEFDLIISYLYDPDQIFSTNVSRCTRAQFITGPHRPKEGTTIHAAQLYLKPLERLAIFDADPIPRLRIGNESSPSASPLRDAAGQGNDRVLALHPGSGGEHKNWPEPNWAELLQNLINDTSFNLLLVGGEAEGERLQRLAAALPPARVRVAQSRPLAELALILQHCAAFIGHDSGISHLAAAVGLPGVILWGETTEEIWRPPSDKMLVLRHPNGLTDLPVRGVLEKIARLPVST